MENVTRKVAETPDSIKRKWRAIDYLLEDAPLNCVKITVEITPDGHSIEYFAPTAEEMARFTWKSVHGEHFR